LIWGRGQTRGRLWYPMKVLHIKHNLFAGTESLSLSVYEPITMRVLWGRPIWGGVELGGLVWYPVTVLYIRHNLFSGTETLSLSVYEPIAIHILLERDRPPSVGGGEMGW